MTFPHYVVYVASCGEYDSISHTVPHYGVHVASCGEYESISHTVPLYVAHVASCGEYESVSHTASLYGGEYKSIPHTPVARISYLLHSTSRTGYHGIVVPTPPFLRNYHRPAHVLSNHLFNAKRLPRRRCGARSKSGTACKGYRSDCMRIHRMVVAFIAAWLCNKIDCVAFECISLQITKRPSAA